MDTKDTSKEPLAFDLKELALRLHAAGFSWKLQLKGIDHYRRTYMRDDEVAEFWHELAKVVWEYLQRWPRDREGGVDDSSDRESVEPR